MNPGDLVRIAEASTAPMYRDLTGHDHLLGYATDGVVCVLLDTSEIAGFGGSKTIRFHRLLAPSHGPVWVRSVWVEKVQ